MKKLTTMLILLVTAAVISTGAGKLAYGEAGMTDPEISATENEPEESILEDEAGEDEPTAIADSPFIGLNELTVTGGIEGTDFTYEVIPYNAGSGIINDKGILTIISDTPVEISGTAEQDNVNRIVVDSPNGANITLNGIYIQHKTTIDLGPAFEIVENTRETVKVTLEGENTLKSVDGYGGAAGIGGTSDAEVTIKGTSFDSCPFVYTNEIQSTTDPADYPNEYWGVVFEGHMNDAQDDFMEGIVYGKNNTVQVTESHILDDEASSYVLSEGKKLTVLEGVTFVTDNMFTVDGSILYLNAGAKLNNWYAMEKRNGGEIQHKQASPYAMKNPLRRLNSVYTSMRAAPENRI